ncbi:uncharacterized protein [Antedon mediterranea]|uniref:uncharacterized protein n=1 Tax=Antedon mediterranea TaxID=105859 RepID=UPI003AF9D840
MNCKKKNTEENKESGSATDAAAKKKAAYRSKPRVNGLSLPLHPLQFVAWFFLIFFNVVYHFIVVPVLPYHWQPAGHIIPGVIISFHIVIHIVCVTLDPADPNVRKKKTQHVKTFDRSEHRHVIENCRCYLCEVPVGTKSKHCSVCNKCVSDFDHHCKWLNNCVGERNYRLFIMCLASALVTCFIVLCVCLYVGVAYWVNPKLLHPDALDDDSIAMSSTVTPNYHDGFEMFGHSVTGTAFFVLICIMVALLILTVCLLGHLLGFHIYLISRKLSTYEYIILKRELKIKKQMDIESQGQSVQEEESPKIKKQKKNKVSPVNDDEELEMETKSKNKLNNFKNNSENDLMEHPDLLPPNTSEVIIHNNNNEATKLRKQSDKKDKLMDSKTSDYKNSVTYDNSTNSATSNSKRSETSDKSMSKRNRKKKRKFLPKNRVQTDNDSDILYPSAQFLPLQPQLLPPQPQFSVEQHYISPVGLSQSLPETYLEQHIVQRFPANAMHRQIPLHVPVTRKNSAVHSTHFPMTISRPLHASNINITPVGPAADYDSDTAESLHEIPLENSSGLANSFDSASYANVWQNQQNFSYSWNNGYNNPGYQNNVDPFLYGQMNQSKYYRHLPTKSRPVVPALDLGSLTRTTHYNSNHSSSSRHGDTSF